MVRSLGKRCAAVSVRGRSHVNVSRWSSQAGTPAGVERHAITHVADLHHAHSSGKPLHETQPTSVDDPHTACMGARIAPAEIDRHRVPARCIARTIRARRRRVSLATWPLTSPPSSSRLRYVNHWRKLSNAARQGAQQLCRSGRAPDRRRVAGDHRGRRRRRPVGEAAGEADRGASCEGGWSRASPRSGSGRDHRVGDGPQSRHGPAVGLRDA